MEAVKTALSPKTKLYPSHNEDNSTEGRESVGEIVTSFVKEIGGKLQTIAIACMDKLLTVDYDVCSIEADIFEQGGIVSGVEKVTGIAVANSKVEQPAFENARRLSTVQCFNSLEEPKKPERSFKMPTREELMATPFSDLKDVIKARQIHPGQLFELNDIQEDRVFGSLITDKTASEKKAEDATRLYDDLKKTSSEKEKEYVALGAQKAFEAHIPKGATTKQKAFLNSRFKAEKLDSLEEDKINEYIKSELDEYASSAKIFGVTDKDTGDVDNGSTPPGEEGDNTESDNFKDAFEAE